MSATDSPRQVAIRAALKRLGPTRVEAFMNALADDDSRCTAVRLIHEDLERGKDLAALLLDGGENGYLLEVKGRGRRFRILFGCCPAPLVGDGGWWNVEFGEDGRVVSCEGDTMWIS